MESKVEGKARPASGLAVCVLFERREPLVRSLFFIAFVAFFEPYLSSATYILGPLKSRLSREMGTSNTEFGLLLAALSLSGTWTPLVGGVMTARLGTTVSSIIATGTVFLGQALLLMGHLHNEVWLMILGMFIFGLGQSPLAGLS
jgi:MFS family permease